MNKHNKCKSKGIKCYYCRTYMLRHTYFSYLIHTSVLLMLTYCNYKYTFQG